MKDTTLAARYAKGLFLTTEKRGETVPAFEDLKALAGVLAPGSRLGSFFATPEIGLEAKREAIRKAVAGRAMPIVGVFLDLLLRKKRLRELPQIVIQLEGLIERSQGVKRAHLVSAVPLGRLILRSALVIWPSRSASRRMRLVTIERMWALTV